MTKLNEEQAKLVKDSHDNWARKEIRDERREIYQLVALEYLRQDVNGIGSIAWRDAAERAAEAIYQGMIKFCGEAK